MFFTTADPRYLLLTLNAVYISAYMSLGSECAVNFNRQQLGLFHCAEVTRPKGASLTWGIVSRVRLLHYEPNAQRYPD